MIIKYADLIEDVKKIRTCGLPQGHKTGWAALDVQFRPERGYFCAATGVPGHGKSEFFDCLMVNMTILHGWKWAVFSPENYPTALHFNKLAEKFIGCPQHKAPDKDYQMATRIIDEHYTWIYPEDDDMTMCEVLQSVKQIKESFGIDGFVIDPWNELDHTRKEGMTETEHIERSLRKFRRFCREENLFGTIVAHPTKMTPLRDGSMPPVTLWSISGSAAWRNKCDYGIVVSREDMKKNEPIIDIQKIKQKNFGKVGRVQMYYDYLSGRMKDELLGKFVLPKA